ncbi:hypothetical protein UUU_33050 [Klebsiella pneumoniae subsp. pneumoniae DSM 30104 = JCM 1662 = NBRC 14940]|nr:hypothetical protein UUU_33050 [Klebsiella pneumoniae subsp. pneumoniae DSM 30104 = JCM 1662 = NBRC 14940]
MRQPIHLLASAIMKRFIHFSSSKKVTRRSMHNTFQFFNVLIIKTIIAALCCHRQ